MIKNRKICLILAMLMIINLFTSTAVFATDEYNIDYNLTNIISTVAPTTVTSGSAINASITANTDYELPDTINVNGTYDNYNYDKDTGNIEITNIQSNIEIVANGVEIPKITDYTVPNKISDIFSDTNLAQGIADWLGLTIDDEITKTDINNGITNTVWTFEQLYLNNKNISDLTGMEIFEGDINSNFGVNLSYNQLTNVDSLKNITSIGFLRLHNNEIKSIEGLNNLKSVKVLDLYSNQLVNVNALTNLTSINELSLWDNKLTDISGLSNLTTVQNSLTLQNNQLTSIDDLSNLTTVQNSLSLQNNQLTNINGLSNLENVYELRLSDNKIVSLSPLANLKSINSLSVDGNNLTNLNGLENITSLDYLTIGNNQIYDISGLRNITSITGYMYSVSNHISQKHFDEVNKTNNALKNYLSSYQINPLSFKNLKTTMSINETQEINTIINLRNGNNSDITSNTVFSYNEIPLSNNSLTFLEDGNLKAEWYGWDVTENISQLYITPKGTVIIKYQDTKGNSLLPDETHSNLDLGAYNYNSKAIDKFTPDSNSKSVTLSADGEVKTLVFVYTANVVPTVPKGTIVIKYQDTKGNSLLPDETHSNLDLGAYNYNSKAIDKFTPDSNSKSTTLIADGEIKTLVFVYTADAVPTVPDPGDNEKEIKGKVTIQYVDSNNNKIKEDELLNNLSLGKQSFTPKLLNNYIALSSPVEVILTEENNNQKITFVYRKPYGTVFINYLLEDGTPLKPRVENIVDLGEYTYNAEEFNGYIFASDKTKTVKIIEDMQYEEIKFLYKLSPTIIEIIETEPQTPKEPKEQKEQKEKDIVPIVKPLPEPIVKDNILGNILVKYITEDGTILEIDEKNNLSLGTYKIYSKQFDGYELIDNVTEKTVELTEDNIKEIVVVEYKYTPVAIPVTAEPQTQPNNNYLLPILLALGAILILIVFSRKHIAIYKVEENGEYLLLKKKRIKFNKENIKINLNKEFKQTENSKLKVTFFKNATRKLGGKTIKFLDNDNLIKVELVPIELNKEFNVIVEK